MDSLINAAARALAVGDPVGALKRIALREDAPALALRGTAMAQLGDLARARELLRRAARAYGAREALARARCTIAEAEIALAARELDWSAKPLDSARAVLAAHGDRVNAAHAAYLEIRRLLLLGRLEQAERALAGFDPQALPPPLRTGHELVVAGIAVRRVQAAAAGAAFARARRAAQAAGIPALLAEVEQAASALERPAARLLAGDNSSDLRLAEVEALLASGTLVVDACRFNVRAGDMRIALAGRPVLFTLAQLLAQAWPEERSRRDLIAHAFRTRHPDDSHRARLRVELGRLRALLRPLADVVATRQGFALRPVQAAGVAVLAQPVDGEHGAVLALLADGEAWASSALALALDVSPRTVQRALESLAQAGIVQAVGKGRARRWMMPPPAGITTALLLPARLANV